MIEIIPAIDIIGGKCVRLQQGDYQKLKEYGNPLEEAKKFEANGLKRLHLVDLDGARGKNVVNIDILEKITRETKLHVDFGGGIKTDDDIQQAFDAGASQVTIGSIAATKPLLMDDWIRLYGTEKIILGADIRERHIAVTGWTDKTELQFENFIGNYLYKGISYVLCTDISKDGMLAGTSMELYKQIMRKFPEIKLIASGGVTNIDEIKMLDDFGIYGVIIGKAIYEGNIRLEDLKIFL
jgi:phosphoribosylformimino-5-aminoimidazole carboxamide ribotide isomerase